MKKRVLSLCLAGLMAASLTGCGGAGNAAETTAAAGAENSAAASEAGSSEAKEELVFVNYRDIRDLNPHLYAGEMYAQEMLYETLVNITADGYEGCLAESWDISDDGKTYTFHIRDGVKFSDGEVCDANAIKANFDAIIENKDRHTWLEMMNLLVGVSAPDDKTFVIELSEPYYPLLTELGVTRPFAMISPKAMKDGSTKDGVNAYIGTGPYVLTDFVTDEYAVFEANENYWGEQPKIKKITVKVIPDNQTRILALEKGEIDMIFGKNMIDADAINQYTGNDKFTVSLSDPTSTRQIVLNTTRDVLADKEVRQALQHATNKQTISEGIFYGLEQPADTLFAKTVPYCDIDLEPYAYDVELAQSMLDEAGWVVGSDKIREKDGQKLTVRWLTYPSRQELPLLAESAQSTLKDIGMDVQINATADHNTIVKDTSAWDVYVGANVNCGLGDPTNFFSTHCLDASTKNRGQYHSDKMEELAVQLNSIFDKTERNQIAIEMQQQLLDDNAFVFCSFLKMSMISQANVTGLTAHASDYYELTADLDIN